jgi:hypothetical protein
MKIVISSAWRITRSYEWLVSFFKERGLQGEIIDVTASLGDIRGQEIETGELD